MAKNMLKHAYLIISHNEFKVLEKLIELLDDERNDIYVHIDKKVKYIPSFNCRLSKLHILNAQERMDVRWGSIRQLKVECRLFEIAHNNGPYQYYHLISGVHLPLKNQDYLHRFFNNCYPQEVIQTMPTNEEEITFKLKRYHLFVNNYMNPNKTIRLIDKLLWRAVLFVEKCLKIQRGNELPHIKSANWASLTEDAISFILEKKGSLLKEYRLTFCADEFYKGSLLYRNQDKFKIKDLPELLAVKFHRGNPLVYTNEDVASLLNSDYLFGRKFSSSDIGAVEKIVDYLHCCPE
jgi:hypothetical protein